MSAAALLRMRKEIRSLKSQLRACNEQIARDDIRVGELAEDRDTCLGRANVAIRELETARTLHRDELSAIGKRHDTERELFASRLDSALIALSGFSGLAAAALAKR